MASDRDARSSRIIQFATFYVDGELFGVDILQMQEIILPMEITKVPRAGDIIEGVINLRGRVIPLISLRARLGLPARAFDKATRIINMEIGGIIVGFLVDSIGYIRQIREEAIEDPPATVAVDSDYISGVIQDGDDMIIVLNTEKLVSADALQEFL